MVSQATISAFPGFSKKNAGKESASVPILMYHEIASKEKISNRWTVAPQEFEADLRYIQENGYEPIVMSDLVNFVNHGGKLPKKPIVLTFDDGLAGVYEYAYPLLRKYNMRAVLSVIGETTDEYSKGGTDDKNRYPHLTWTQIGEMVKSGCIELQNHSYSMHKSVGAKKRKQESLSDYKERLSTDLMNLQTRIKEMTAAEATTFVYPFGEYSDETKNVLHELGFSASLGCYDTVNQLTQGQPDCLYNLGRTLREQGRATEKYFAKFQSATEKAVEKAEPEIKEEPKQEPTQENKQIDEQRIKTKDVKEQQEEKKEDKKDKKDKKNKKDKKDKRNKKNEKDKNNFFDWFKKNDGKNEKENDHKKINDKKN
jgi:peptidoglycan/xylan/chitin deacetylase (PgdA/CDA1 family)